MEKLENFKELYNKNGFVCLRNVVSINELNKLNELIVLEKEKSFVLSIDHLLKNREIYSLQFNFKILLAIRQIFGAEACLLNDINIQVEQFYNDRADRGWHIDAGGERLAKYLFNQDYGYAKIGLYLKDNSTKFGGGIDVEIGGHKSFRYFGSGHFGYALSLISYFFDRIFLSPFRKKVTLDTSAGDVVIFDSRLPHRSTPKLEHQEDVSRKVAVYWQVAKNQKNANYYLIHSMNMASFDKNNFRHYRQFLSYNFPHDYPKVYVEECKKVKINVASLTKEIAGSYKGDFDKEKNYDEIFFEKRLF